MKIYVSSSSNLDEICRSERWITSLKDIGVEVTSTWPASVKRVGSGNPAHATHQDRYSYAFLDMTEVDKADALWMLMPPEGVYSAGAFWEFGYATARNKRTYISGPGQNASVFTALATMQLPADEDAFNLIKSLIR